MTVSKEELLEDKLERFFVALRSHDFLYDYSDDGKVWRKGQETKKEIDKMMSDLMDVDRVMGEAAKNIYLAVMYERHPFMVDWIKDVGLKT